MSHGHLLSMGGYTLVRDLDGKGRLPKPREPGLMSTAEDWEQYRELWKHHRRCQLGTLTVDDLKRLVEDSEFEFPDISQADIQDRSKGDVLFKIIAILQTTWFIIQCIARGHQGLAITELELVTLALASLNAVTFAIWWHKPLGVQEPVKIYLKTEARRVEDAASVKDRRRRFDPSFGDVISEGWEFVKRLGIDLLPFLRNPCEAGPILALLGLSIALPIFLIYVVSFPFFVLFPLSIILLLRIIETEPVSQETSQSRGLLAARIVASLQSLRYRLSSAVGKFVGRWLKEIFSGDVLTFFFGWFILFPSLFVLLLLFISFLVPFLTLLFLVSFIFTAVFGIATTSTIPPGASHVPSFYAPVTTSDRWSRMIVFALFGITFGGLHCIGWNFKFPTHSEQTLWRTTSLAITVIPLIVAPIDFHLAARNINSCPKAARRALLVLDLVMTILLFIYVPARLSLLAQAIALLRNQPQSALVAVDWTKYVPHLFLQ